MTTVVEIKLDYVYLGSDDEYFYITAEHDDPGDPYPMIGSYFSDTSDTDWRRFANSLDCTEIGHKDDYPEFFI